MVTQFMGVPEIAHKVFIMVEEKSCTWCQSPYVSFAGCVQCSPVKEIISSYIVMPEDK